VDGLLGMTETITTATKRLVGDKSDTILERGALHSRRNHHHRRSLPPLHQIYPSFRGWAIRNDGNNNNSNKAISW
jgi:hypothetical protein